MSTRPDRPEKEIDDSEPNLGPSRRNGVNIEVELENPYDKYLPPTT